MLLSLARDLYIADYSIHSLQHAIRYDDDDAMMFMTCIFHVGCGATHDQLSALQGGDLERTAALLGLPLVLDTFINILQRALLTSPKQHAKSTPLDSDAASQLRSTMFAKLCDVIGTSTHPAVVVAPMMRALAGMLALIETHNVQIHDEELLPSILSRLVGMTSSNAKVLKSQGDDGVLLDLFVTF